MDSNYLENAHGKTWHDNSVKDAMIVERVESAVKSGWKITNIPTKSIERSIWDAPELQKVVVVCSAGHYCVMSTTSMPPCDICKILEKRKDLKCLQKVYRQGRKTFEFACKKDHRLLLSSYKKNVEGCPACLIESHYLSDKQIIKIDNVCIYETPMTKLRAHCTQCSTEFYVNYGQHRIDFGVTGSKPPLRKARPQHCLCSYEHWPQDGINKSIADTLQIIEFIFDQRFDDNDSMAAADEGILKGIYFTGYNRKLKIAFIHSLDHAYDKDSIVESAWCESNGIRLLNISARHDTGNDGLITRICSEIVYKQVPHRFSTYLNDDASDLYKSKELSMIVMIEMEKETKKLKNRM